MQLGNWSRIILRKKQKFLFSMISKQAINKCPWLKYYIFWASKLLKPFHSEGSEVVWKLPSPVAAWVWLFGTRWYRHGSECRILQELTVFMLSPVGMLLCHLKCWNIVTRAVKGLYCLSDKCSCPSGIYCRCSGCIVCLDLDHWGGENGELVSVCPLWPWACCPQLS